MFAVKPVVDDYMGELLSRYNISGEQQKPKSDLDNIKFEPEELGEIDFEKDRPIAFDAGIEPEGVYEGLVKPTAKALVKVPAAVVSSVALLPGAGIASLIELLPTISSNPDELVQYGSLEDAMDTYKQVMSIPGKFITTSAEQKAVENISLVMKPIEMAGEGWGEIGRLINDGLVQLGLAPTYLEPLLATYGEAAAMFSIPEVIGYLKNSTAFRMMTISERGLVVQSLAETMAKNPGMTEGQILRTYSNPMWISEALSKRSIVESYGELKKYASVKSREAKVEAAVETYNKEPAKGMTPEDAVPSHIFTSKKGNRYFKVDDKWYDKGGKEVTNKFIMRAAEQGKVSAEVDKMTEDIDTISEIEKKYGKDIDKVTDDEIEKFFTEREEKEPETEIDWFGEGKKTTIEEDIAELEEMPEISGQFRKEPSVTKRNLETLPEYNKIDNPDTLLARMEAEVNNWADGAVEDADMTLDLLEKLTDQSKLWANGTEAPTGIFRDMTGTKLYNFSEYLEDMNKWARDLRSKIERSEGVELYSGIPIDKVLKDAGFFAREIAEGVSEKHKKLALEGRVFQGSQLVRVTEEMIAGKQRWVDELKSKLAYAERELPKYPNELVGTEVAGKFLWGDTREFTKTGIIESLKNRIKDAQSGVDRYRRQYERGREETKLYSGVPLDAMGRTIKKSASKLIDKLTNRSGRKVPDKPSDPFSDVKKEITEIVHERRGRLNLANYETNKFIDSIEKKTTLKQRETFVFALEKTSVPEEFNRPDIQRVLDRDREHIEAVSKEIKDWFNEGWKKIKYHIPDLSVKQIEDYVTHLWDVPKHKRAEATNWFTTQNRFLERRFIPTYAEGIKQGYIPKTLDISEIIRIHDSICNRSIENVRYINRLMKMKRDGMPLMQRSAEAPLDWVEVDYPAITRRIPVARKTPGKKGEFVRELKVRVHPDLVRPLKAIFEERFDHPIISAYEAINGIIKKTNLSVSLFHHGALGETGIALIGVPKTVNLYLNPVKIYKGLVRGEYDLFTKEEIAKDSILHGVQYGATADIPIAKIQGYLNDLARVSANTPIAGRLAKFLSDFNSVWDKALWSYLHDTLKLYGYESLVGKLDPKLGADATKLAKREIAQLVNDAFGGQNWDTLMMTPKEVQMLTWTLLSADWTTSTTRQALAPTGIGKVYNETAPLRRKMGLIFWLRAALFFGVGMNMLNVMYRNRDMEENPQYYRDMDYSFFDKTMFGNTVGKKTYLFKGRYKDGSERYVRWGKQFRDFFELLITPFRKLGGKMAPIPQLISEMLTGHSLSGFENDDIHGTKGMEKVKGIFKSIAKAPLPISVKRFMKEDMEFKPLDIVMQSSKGMTRYTAMDYFKKAIIDSDEDLLSDTYEGALRNNLPAFTLFNSALAWAESEIMADIIKDTKSIEDARSKLVASETAFDRRRYGKILKSLEKEKADKEAGLKLFRSALEKARIYEKLGSDSTTPRFPASKTRGNAPGRGLGTINFE